MSTLRVTNIEAKKDPSSPLVDEKVKLTNSDGDVVLEVNGKNVGAGQTVFVGSGIVTATTFNGDVTGTATNALNIKDSDGNVKLSTNSSGMVMSGIATITSGKLMVGNAYVDATAVGIGSTTTSGRNAGVGTMTGSLVFDADLGTVQVYTGTDGWKAVYDAPFSATGGTIDSSTFTGYNVHIFTSPGTFTVAGGTNTADVLVVGGGGGGAGSYGGGGGAGAYIVTPGVPLAAGNYSVTIGAGGVGNAGGGSPFYPPSPGAYAPYPDATYATGQIGGDSVFNDITAPGGGGGGSRGTAGGPSPGGSGGGAGDGYPTGGLPGGTSGTYGNNGGGGSPSPTSQNYSGGGGGGAGAVGTTVASTSGGPGGNGTNTFTYAPPSYGTPGPSPGRWFAGGGGGGNVSSPVVTTTGGAGGGGKGGSGSGLPERPGGANTGGGGGGAPDGSPTQAGAGGSGIVIVAYPTA